MTTPDLPTQIHTADVRELAARALYEAEPYAFFESKGWEELGDGDREDLLGFADAVLAAVSPVIRREERAATLRWAAERLIDECETPEVDDCGVIAIQLQEWAAGIARSHANQEEKP